jgi:hypothetical protein
MVDCRRRRLRRRLDRRRGYRAGAIPGVSRNDRCARGDGYRCGHRPEFRHDRHAAASDEPDNGFAQQRERIERSEPGVPGASGRRPARLAGPKVALERAPGREVERVGPQLAHGVAIEALPEGELLGEPVAGREQRLLDLLDRELEHRADLRDAKPLDLAQEVGGPLKLGQVTERVHERCAELGGLVTGAGLVLLVELGTRGTAPPRLERRVVRDAVEPGADVARPRAAAKGLVRVQQGDLGDVLAGRRISRDSTAVRREPASVEPVELLEGGTVARRDGVRQTRVIDLEGVNCTHRRSSTSYEELSAPELECAREDHPFGVPLFNQPRRWPRAARRRALTRASRAGAGRS